MNKLEVAIKLLRLINNRKIINSKIISEELNVSLRTAQRYLKELSTLPYIVSLDNNGNYEIYSDYKLKEAVLSPNVCELILKEKNDSNNAVVSSEVLCSVCGYGYKGVKHTIFRFDNNDISSNQNFDKLQLAIRNILSSEAT